MTSSDKAVAVLAALGMLLASLCFRQCASVDCVRSDGEMRGLDCQPKGAER